MIKKLLAISTLAPLSMASCSNANVDKFQISYFFGSGINVNDTNNNAGSQNMKFNVIESRVDLKNDKLVYSYRESTGYVDLTKEGIALPDSAKANAELVDFTDEKIKEVYAINSKQKFDGDLSDWLISNGTITSQAELANASITQYNTWRDSFLADTSTGTSSFQAHWGNFAEPLFPKINGSFKWNKGESLREVFDIVETNADVIEKLQTSEGRYEGFIGKTNSYHTDWVSSRNAIIASMSAKYSTCDLIKDVTNDDMKNWSKQKVWSLTDITGTTYSQTGIYKASLAKTAKKLCGFN